MIASRTSTAALGSVGGERTERPTVWGLDVVQLHDRYWASKRVQVVRRGVTAVESGGPQLYLLVEADELLFIDLKPLVQRLSWLKPRAMRLRIVDSEAESYVETVESDAQDRFIAVRRRYRARTRATHRAWLTSDAKLARKWSSSAASRAGLRMVRESCGEDRYASAVCRGSVYDAAIAEDRDRAATAVIERWRQPGAMLDGIYEFEPGVWVHETVRFAGTARFVPPVWAGAGLEIADGALIVGARIVADRAGERPDPGETQWDTVSYPSLPFVVRPRWRWLRMATKRAFDVCFSLAALAGTLPLYPFIMLAIYVEDGRPFFFGHRRQTLRGREFDCWKFRTMYRNAEQLKAQLATNNVCDGPQFFIENDPRTLRVGRVLRRFQLDELPQFFNVLLGHMSVVGPRPSPDKENQICPAWREGRLSVRPGVTGLWQVRRTRAKETDFQEWIRYDLEYVQHQSWRLDVWIIFKTVMRVLRG